jgi:hypothetical protein
MTTTTRRQLTPLDPAKTERARNLRSQRTQVWEATSADGRWCYQRTEEPGTPWRVTDLTANGIASELFGSLGAARAWTALPEVGDNPGYAWRNLSEPHPVLDRLPADFVHDYRALLDEAGELAMATTLPWAWDRLGYRMATVPADQVGQRNSELPDVTYCRTWDRAAEWINPLTLVDKACLVDRMRRYLNHES